jgi:hypothetical protein
VLRLAWIVVAGLLSSLTAAGGGGANERALPFGWWEGTVVAQEKWDLVDDIGTKVRGSATLRVERISYTKAEWELLAFEEEIWSLVDSPFHPPTLCLGTRTGKSQKGTLTRNVGEFGPGKFSGFHADDVAAGASFVVAARLKITVFRTVDSAPGCPQFPGIETRPFEVVLYAQWEFVSRQSDSATPRRGSAPQAAESVYQQPGDFAPRPGGANSASVRWDLRLEPSGPVKTQIVLARPRPSSVAATVNATQKGHSVPIDSARCTFSFPNTSFGTKTAPAVPVSHGKLRCPVQFDSALYRGKGLVGSMTVRARGRTVTRRFSVRIGRGTALSSPVGATLKR